MAVGASVRRLSTAICKPATLASHPPFPQSAHMTRQAPSLAGKMLYGAILFGYMYHGPPFRLKDKGLGPVVSFLALGPLAISAFYLAQVRGC